MCVSVCVRVCGGGDVGGYITDDSVIVVNI